MTDYPCNAPWPGLVSGGSVTCTRPAGHDADHHIHRSVGLTATWPVVATPATIIAGPFDPAVLDAAAALLRAARNAEPLEQLAYAYRLALAGGREA